MDSQLVYALKEGRQGRALPAVPRLHAELKTQVDGMILVDVVAVVNPELVKYIKDRSGLVINQVPEYKTFRALIPLELISDLAHRNDVESIRPADEMTTMWEPSDGAISHRVPEAVATFGATGNGVKVGVLSDSVKSLVDLHLTDWLPAVTILPGQGGTGTGEGTAMVEIVHNLASGAEVYFATGVGSAATFAQNIRGLAAAGCKVIADDILYFCESPFQDGIIAQAVNSVCADGVPYFSAAGNSGSALQLWFNLGR
jgi:hypothetical protein